MNGFDEAFFQYGEELDLSCRVRKAGHHVWYVHTGPVIWHRNRRAGETNVERTDMWAFDVLLYEMVTGKRLFSVRIVCSEHVIFSAT
jgi:GT2 family glycosyltransferase